ncbi:MAG TPA: hypothetical protein VH912_06865 [Streptosporangiaceae bacterium]
MKIPKSVNKALDRAGQNIRVVVAVAAAVIVSIVFWWLPLLSAFVLGITVGGILVHMRMAPRQTALRADVDDLLRQNGALRREKLTLASGVITSQSRLTAKLPVIPEDPEDPEDPGTPADPKDPKTPADPKDPKNRKTSKDK